MCKVVCPNYCVTGWGGAAIKIIERVTCVLFFVVRPNPVSQDHTLNYEGCLESKDTKILTMYNIFNLQKRHCQ